jgi:hypothetical protein
LSGFTLSAQFCTQKTRIDDRKTVNIPQSVLNALTTCGLPQTVGGLLELANRALAGLPTCGATIGDLNSAVSAINEGFDECRVPIDCAAP